MSSEEQALYDAALLVAWQLAKGENINPMSPAAIRLRDAAIAAAAADGGKSLREGAEAV